MANVPSATHCKQSAKDILNLPMYSKVLQKFILLVLPPVNKVTTA
jgi:hypothetical protein